MSTKKSAYDALMKYSQNQLKVPARRAVRNDKPEARIVLDILRYCRSVLWSVDVVESKAVYNAAAGTYTHGKTRPGFSDIVGCNTFGHALYIEVKNVGKLKNVSPAQMDFLTEKINHHAFAVVVDGTDRLATIYSHWSQIVVDNDRRKYLLSLLP